MDAVDRTDVDTGRVLRADARFVDDVRHAMSSKHRKHDWQPRSITRAFSAVLVCTVCVALQPHGSALSALRPAQAGPRRRSRQAGGKRRSTSGLFAPRRSPAAYRAYVSPLGLELYSSRSPPTRPPSSAGRLDAAGDDSLRRVRAERQLQSLESGWPVSKPARASGPGTTSGPGTDGVLDAHPPYPDAALQRLEPGTLIIVLRIPSDYGTSFVNCHRPLRSHRRCVEPVVWVSRPWSTRAVIRIASSLTNRIFIASTLLAIVSLGLAFYFVNARVSSEAEADLRRSLTEAATLVDLRRENLTDTFRTMARLVADIPKLKASMADADAAPRSRSPTSSVRADLGPPPRADRSARRRARRLRRRC